ncbi:uroporphyrinogen-III C-methyltransferase [Wenzhouxiangella sp. EGI_FJ10409]|uniref:uroporphyrinogen-III C-methyltransferase n=1 Tax=Wenzhouxiangella sp. EGI_FJ10409 TaxID=3243767 RepID=UPI0035DF7D88
MSEQKEPHQNEATEPDHPVVHDDAGEDSAAVGTDSSSGRDSHDTSTSNGGRRGGNGLAWLALLLALAAAGLSAWQWWLSTHSEVEADPLAPRLEEQVDALEEQADALDAQSRRTSELSDRLDALSGRFGEIEGRLPEDGFEPQALRRADDDLSSAQADLEQRQADLEQRVDALSRQLDQAVSAMDSQLEELGTVRTDRIDESLAEASFRLGLIEVAGLLRLGQSRAELAADYDSAVSVYRRAQARLESIDDSRAQRLRQLVGQELEALRSIEATDWSALVGELAALEGETGQWPMQSRQAATDEPESDSGGDGGEGEGDGWWAELRRSMGGLVRVSPRESAPLTPAAAESVRERLRLHLAAAQVAAARRDSEELANHAAAAVEVIDAHFDSGSDSVKGALETLSAMTSAVSPQSLPELGDALAEAERRLAAS